MHRPPSHPVVNDPLDLEPFSVEETVLSEADWKVRFRQEGAKFAQTLQRVAEEHLRQQELLVVEILERAQPALPGARQEELPSVHDTLTTEFRSFKEQLCQPEHLKIPEGGSEEDHSAARQEEPRESEFTSGGTALNLSYVPKRSQSCNFPLGDAPGTKSSKSDLRDYLDTQMGDLTAGVMSVQAAAQGSFQSHRSWLQRLAICLKFEEPERRGCLARLVTSTQFEIVTFVVIALYGGFAVWMTNELMSKPDTLESPTVVWVDTFFLLFFVVELVTKLSVHRLYFFCNADVGWNLLDFLIIIFSLVDFFLNAFTQSGGPVLQDMNYMRVLRVLRISKSLRILRAVRFVSELRVLVNCIVTSFSVLFWCIILLLLIQAGVSTALVQLVAGHVHEQRSQEVEGDNTQKLVLHFGSVQASMMSLFMSTTGGRDWGEFFELVGEAGTVATLFYTSYLIFFFIAAWNIITSLFIEKAMALAQPDLETQMLSKHREDMQHASDIVKILEETDNEKSGTISLSRFKKYMEIPRFRTFFEFRDLEIKDAEMFFRMLSAVSNSEDVPYETFAYGCMRMKGYASSLDVQSLRIELKTMYLNQTSLFKLLSEELCALRNRLTDQSGQEECMGLEAAQLEMPMNTP